MPENIQHSWVVLLWVFFRTGFSVQNGCALRCVAMRWRVFSFGHSFASFVALVGLSLSSHSPLNSLLFQVSFRCYSLSVSFASMPYRKTDSPLNATMADWRGNERQCREPSSVRGLKIEPSLGLCLLEACTNRLEPKHTIIRYQNEDDIANNEPARMLTNRLLAVLRNITHHRMLYVSYRGTQAHMVKLSVSYLNGWNVQIAVRQNYFAHVVFFYVPLFGASSVLLRCLSSDASSCNWEDNAMRLWWKVVMVNGLGLSHIYLG